MLSCTRWLKVGYFLTLATALVLLLSKPAPIQAQRTLAYPFLPGPFTTAAAMASVLASGGTPMDNYTNVTQMLQLAGQPAGLGVGGGPPQQSFLGGNGVGMGGGGIGGGLGGIGGGLGGIGGGLGGFGGGFAGIGGIAGAGGFPGGGLGGGIGGIRGIGGMGGFAGKGFGGFNGKKPL